MFLYLPVFLFCFPSRRLCCVIPRGHERHQRKFSFMINAFLYHRQLIDIQLSLISTTFNVSCVLALGKIQHSIITIMFAVCDAFSVRPPDESTHSGDRKRKINTTMSRTLVTERVQSVVSAPRSQRISSEQNSIPAAV